MDYIMMTAAIAIAVVFGTGVMAGVMAMIAMAVHREDKRHTLTREPPDLVASGVRRLTGYSFRDITPHDHQDRAGPDGDEPDQPEWWQAHGD